MAASARRPGIRTDAGWEQAGADRSGIRSGAVAIVPISDRLRKIPEQILDCLRQFYRGSDLPPVPFLASRHRLPVLEPAEIKFLKRFSRGRDHRWIQRHRDNWAVPFLWHGQETTTSGQKSEPK